MTEYIRGSGGGKSGGSESPNTLKSSSFAKVLDLLCEGEIEGLVGGDAGIYINDIPLVNSAGGKNYENYNYNILQGTQAQGYLSDFANVQSERGIQNSVVKKNLPVYEKLVSKELDAVRVTVGTPYLTTSDDEGNVTGGSIVYKVSISDDNGATYTLKVHDKIEGKTTTAYERSVVIDLHDEWKGKTITVKVERVTADFPDTAVDGVTKKGELLFYSVAEIIYDRLRYPNSAIVGVKISSDYFSSIPSRAYDVNLLKVRVPSNYTPRSPTGGSSSYVNDSGANQGTEIWDGVLSPPIWTDNPAWCFYDLLTNTRYGLGEYIDEDTVDKWSLYEIARYCDGLVPDGFGGWEPRYTCNMFLQNRTEAITALRDMAKIFRGMLYWNGQVIATDFDRPQTAEALFTNANVIDGRFNYAGSSLQAKKNVVKVTWNDPDNDYARAVEYVEDSEELAKDNVPIRDLEINATGCTSRGQAYRIGKWALYTSKYESEILSFTTTDVGMHLHPGSLVNISDSLKNSSRRGGRIAEVIDASTVRLDRPINFNPNNPGKLIVEVDSVKIENLPDGSTVERNLSTLVSAVIDRVDSDLVFLSSSITAPLIGSIWIYNETGIAEPQLAKILSITEDSDAGTYAITCHKVNNSKFGYIENGWELEKKYTSDLNVLQASPISGKFDITEELYLETGIPKVQISVGWDDVLGAKHYILHYKKDLDNWKVADLQSLTSQFDLRDASNGTYVFRVATVNAFGKVSAFVESDPTLILGKTKEPSDVTNLSVRLTEAGIYLEWQAISDLDVKGYEVRLGESWEDSDNGGPGIILSTNISQNSFVTTAVKGADTYKYHVRAIDTTGHYSINSASAELDISELNRVYGFACVQSLGRLEFSWKRATSIGILGYEVREGTSWTDSTYIGFVNTNKLSLPYGSSATGTARKFFIKAFSSAGLYSKYAAFASTLIAKPTQRNAIKDINFHDTWAGVLVNTTQESSTNTVGQAIWTSYDEDSGEFLGDIVHSKEYTAQTTLSFAHATYLKDSVNWDNATFDWFSTESLRRWVMEYDQAVGDVSLEIATDTEIPATVLDAWRFHSVDGLNSAIGTAPIGTPKNSLIESPARGRYSAGVSVEPVTSNDYTITRLPTVFSETLWLRPKEISSFSSLVKLSNESSEYLKLTYSKLANRLYLEDQAGNRVGLDYNLVVDKLVFIGISQTETTRSLYASNKQGTNVTGNTELLPPNTLGYNKLEVI
jgi:predicted phage tail protein